MSTYGNYEFIIGEVTEEKVRKAKENVLTSLIKILVEESKRDDFWIIKDGKTGEYPLGRPSVGAKFILPTVDENKDKN